MTTYLVTGGCGFIGSHLVDTLVGDGHGVRVLDDLSTGKRENLSEKAELVVGDAADFATVAAAVAGMDGVFHLAAVASVERGTEDWVGTHRVNQTATVNVFEAARKAGKDGAPLPVVYTSSAAVYGDNPDMPLGEESATRPLSAYGADKLGCDLHGRVAAEVHGMAAAGLRLFNVFGPRQDPHSPYSGVISIFAERIRQGQDLMVFGDGGQQRDFVYVGDVVQAFRAAMRACEGATGKGAPLHEVFNICTGRPTTLLELVAALEGVCGVTAAVRHEAPRTGDIRISLGNPEKAARQIAFRAGTGLAEGLAALIESLGGVRKVA